MVGTIVSAVPITPLSLAIPAPGTRAGLPLIGALPPGSTVGARAGAGLGSAAGGVGAGLGGVGGGLDGAGGAGRDGAGGAGRDGAGGAGRDGAGGAAGRVAAGDDCLGKIL